MVKNTYVLIDTLKKIYPVSQFFKDRYFPDGKTFYSEKALIEMKKGGRTIAPYVVPVVGGIAMTTEGYRAEQVEAPFIAPKFTITAADIEKKAFGESAESGRTPEDRENEVEAEKLEEGRNMILRRHEEMATEVITTGKLTMKHYATAEDAANGTKGQVKLLQFYENEFNNVYLFQTVPGNTGTTFAGLDDAEAWMGQLFDMASVLRKRGVKATDLVMTSDVAKLLYTKKDFLKFFDFRRVEIGNVNPVATPEGVDNIGTLNISGILFNVFVYDDQFVDLDGTTKEFLPAGTIAMLAPGMGTTVYGQVTFLEGDSFRSYAEKIVPRVVGNEIDSIKEVQLFSRPVPYPKDQEGWLVANIYTTLVGKDDSEDSVTEDDPDPDATLKTEAEINAITSKAAVVAYGTSIGMDKLTTDDGTLAELKVAVIAYQKDVYGEDTLA